MCSTISGPGGPFAAHRDRQTLDRLLESRVRPAALQQMQQMLAQPFVIFPGHRFLPRSIVARGKQHSKKGRISVRRRPVVCYL
jgi:hypothetical protein